MLIGSVELLLSPKIIDVSTDEELVSYDKYSTAEEIDAVSLQKGQVTAESFPHRALDLHQP